MGDSSDRGSSSDSQWSDSLTGESLTEDSFTGDSLAGAALADDGYPSTRKSVRIRKGEASGTPMSWTTSRLVFNLEGDFSTSRQNAEKSIFKYVWMGQDHMAEESTEEGEEEGQYRYVYQTRFSRDSVLRANIDEYSIRRTILPVREGRGGKKNPIGDNAKNGMKMYGGKFKREMNPRMGRTPQGGRGEAEEGCGNILLESAWKGIKLEEAAPFGSAPFGSVPFGGGPFCSDPYLCYPLQLCSRDVKQRRSIAKEPYRVLSAPNLVDDFYLNLVHWSRQNVIAVGLHDKLWNYFGNYLAVGLSNGVVQIWDLEKEVKIRKYKNHKRRVGAVGWHYNTLTTGSRDNKIVSSDIRCKESSYAQLTNHTSEVCGLQWNYKTKQLASGGNDNSVYIWEWRKCVPLFQLTKHTAAVKAISWSPHKHNLLATGGGSADKKIFFWDTATGECLNELPTSSQVSNLFWAKHTDEFVSTHSYSLGQVVVWKYPRLRKVSALSGHALRVLYGALSPEGESIVTGSPDETLRLWRVFPRGGGNGVGDDGVGKNGAGRCAESCLGSCLGSCLRSCLRSRLDDPHGSHRLTDHPPHQVPFSNCYEQVR
ncbi:cell division cycle 20-like protein 1, cofactor-APC complex [Plasmodium inui San Antonio 1]|uniref:Cell division cycle 20-like protein 1, cofactor-APC complex n=1 Tax=Plasmodium inui San Antonio 1 TaxID=1237626 RepID=W7A3J0_9APIC|nr:cell division cycle 20-like protein 1, cofactor-APC complex [Plasmodium inui San Antonio 1]EUD66220.1 cell division cycle 20-like protein 1, cofactor-APC complex [Plasmodium inui San Antonio 1]